MLAWIIHVGAFKRLWAVPAALAAFMLVVVFGVDVPEAPSMPSSPVASADGRIRHAGVQRACLRVDRAARSSIVTMASQNIPGIMMKVNGYETQARAALCYRPVSSRCSRPPSVATCVNLAAITAAMCAGPDAHPSQRRYWAVLSSAASASDPQAARGLP